MHRLSVFALAAALLVPAGGGAQQWTGEQLDVINSLEACWDIWMDSIAQDNPDVWLDQCTDGDFSYWWSVEGAPNGPETLRRDWERVKRTDRDWLDLRPIAVKIVDDIAIMHFYGYWDANTPEGPLATEALRTEVFQRVDGRWVLVAGHSTPASAADAEPYRE